MNLKEKQKKLSNYDNIILQQVSKNSPFYHILGQYNGSKAKHTIDLNVHESEVHKKALKYIQIINKINSKDNQK